MNAPLQPLHTNEVSPEFLCRLDDSREGESMAEDFLPAIEGAETND